MASKFYSPCNSDVRFDTINKCLNYIKLISKVFGKENSFAYINRWELSERGYELMGTIKVKLGA